MVNIHTAHDVSNRRMFATMIRGAVFRRRSRALMAIVATLVGAATLFCLAAVCIVVPQQMRDDMRSFGANLIVRTSDGGANAQDVRTITQDVTAVGDAQSATYRYENVRIHAAPYMLAGIDSNDVQAINHHWSVDGHWPSNGHIMVGRDVATALDLKVGSTLEIAYRADDNTQSGSQAQSTNQAQSGSQTQSDNQMQQGQTTQSHSRDGRVSTDILQGGGTKFQVGGIVDTGGNEDDIIYATNHDVNQLAGERGVDVIEFAVDADADTLFSMSQAIAAQDGLSVPVSARQVSRMTSSNERIITMLQTLFWMVSLVVLALTLVGVSTTMASMVGQRRNEIGLRKALGASSWSIGMEFCIESVLYGVIGALLGIGIGQAVASVLCQAVFDRSLPFNPLLAVITVGAAIIIDIVACIPPVRRAASIDPAVVLREE